MSYNVYMGKFESKDNYKEGDIISISLQGAKYHKSKDDVFLCIHVLDLGFPDYYDPNPYNGIKHNIEDQPFALKCKAISSVDDSTVIASFIEKINPEQFVHLQLELPKGLNTPYYLRDPCYTYNYDLRVGRWSIEGWFNTEGEIGERWLVYSDDRGIDYAVYKETINYSNNYSYITAKSFGSLCLGKRLDRRRRKILYPDSAFIDQGSRNGRFITSDDKCFLYNVIINDVRIYKYRNVKKERELILPVDWKCRYISEYMCYFRDDDIKYYVRLFIEDRAFYGNYELETVFLPDNVVSIGAEAFKKCYSLKQINIPKSVNVIHDDAFAECSRGLVLIVHEGSIGHRYAILNDFKYQFANEQDIGVMLETYPHLLDKNRKDLYYNNRFISSQIEQAKSYKNNVSLEQFTIPEGTKKIGSETFLGCDNLTEVTISEGVEKIGAWAFRGCTGIKRIILPNSLTELGDGVFFDCKQLERIVIPENVKKIGARLFWGCSSLKKVILPAGLRILPPKLFIECESLEEIAVPEGVLKIGYSAFEDCEKLIKVTLPDSLEEIGDCSFSGCGSLTSISIPKGVKRIGTRAFSYCSSLKEVTILNSTVEIGKDAFEECDLLEKISMSGEEETN